MESPPQPTEWAFLYDSSSSSPSGHGSDSDYQGSTCSEVEDDPLEVASDASDDTGIDKEEENPAEMPRRSHDDPLVIAIDVSDDDDVVPFPIVTDTTSSPEGDDENFRYYDDFLTPTSSGSSSMMFSSPEELGSPWEKMAVQRSFSPLEIQTGHSDVESEPFLDGNAHQGSGGWVFGCIQVVFHWIASFFF